MFKKGIPRPLILQKSRDDMKGVPERMEEKEKVVMKRLNERTDRRMQRS